jgi:hypothetical protein
MRFTPVKKKENVTNRIVGLEPYSDSVCCPGMASIEIGVFFSGVSRQHLQVVRRAHCMSLDDLKPLGTNQAGKWPKYNAELKCDD